MDDLYINLTAPSSEQWVTRSIIIWNGAELTAFSSSTLLALAPRRRVLLSKYFEVNEWKTTYTIKNHVILLVTTTCPGKRKKRAR